MPVEVLKCPNCGAPFEGVFEITRCPYCNTNIHVQLNQGGKNAVVSSGAAANSDPETNAMVAMLVNLCRQGKKIEAIKLYRERTGDGLYDAKNAVEGLEQGLSMPQVMEKLRVGTKRTA
jgi:ribosomal protein L7/L12